ncbi:MAG: Hsp20 family protein [Chitinophagaceae bacterium]|nr:Hsp20 family protein [Chitinophagaceae bacterium]
MPNIIKKDNARPAAFGSVVDQIFQDNLSRFFDDDYWGVNGPLHRQNVPVNLRETDKSYEMEVVAPGLKKQDFQLNISDDTLSISFEHKQEDNQKDASGQWIRREYRAQAFSRSFNLDETVDASNIAARYEDGVLHVSIPKKENAKKISRTIDIQ